MYKKFSKLICCLIMLLSLAVVSACSDNSARELYKTAEFEELQNNREHAIQLYREISSKYPKTEYGEKAKERLEKLDEQP